MRKRGKIFFCPFKSYFFCLEKYKNQPHDRSLLFPFVTFKSVGYNLFKEGVNS